jgi:hypothetical protein
MEDTQEHHDYAIIRDEDNILIALENDYETAKKIAIENKCPVYYLGDCQLNGGKKLIGKQILSGSCRWKFTLQDLIEESLCEDYFGNISLLETLKQIEKDENPITYLHQKHYKGTPF